MQNNFLTTIRSLKIIDGCKGAPVYPFNPSSSSAAAGEPGLHSFSIRSKPGVQQHGHNPSLSVAFDAVLPCGLPSADLIDPPVDPFLRPVDPVAALADSFRRLSAASPSPDADGEQAPEQPSPSAELCDLHLEQLALLRSVGDPKLLRRSLRAARAHAPDAHHKVVLAAWLRYERREDQLDPAPAPLAPCSSTSPAAECPRAALSSAPGPCPCRRPPDPPSATAATQPLGDPDEEPDLWFCIGDDEVGCLRRRVAALSAPLSTLLYGGFAESRRAHIQFSHNGISTRGMKAVDVYSRTARLDDFPPDTVLELLAFSNKFCCEGLKAACDARLAHLVRSTDDALLLVEYGLEETAYLLVAACLQAFLRDLPKSLSDPDITRLLCSPEGRDSLAAAGHTSFLLYHFASQVAMEEDLQSNTTVMLLERMVECAAPGWQEQLALHQLGCIMLEREEYKDAQKWFRGGRRPGHVYSIVGVARAK